MSHHSFSQSQGVNSLSLLAGAVYGAFLGGLLFGSSWLSLLVGAVLGLFLLSGIMAKLALRTAGTWIAMSDTHSGWTQEHERRGERIAKILLTLLTIAALFGFLFGTGS